MSWLIARRVLQFRREIGDGPRGSVDTTVDGQTDLLLGDKWKMSDRAGGMSAGSFFPSLIGSQEGGASRHGDTQQPQNTL